jgi:hypothetical protein
MSRFNFLTLGVQLIFVLLSFWGYGQTQNFKIKCGTFDTLTFTVKQSKGKLFLVNKPYFDNKNLYCLDLQKQTTKTHYLYHPDIAFSDRYPLKDLIISGKNILLVYGHTVLRYKIINEDSIVFLKNHDLIGGGEGYVHQSAFIDSFDKINTISTQGNYRKNMDVYRIIHLGNNQKDSIISLNLSEMYSFFNIGPSKYFHLSPGGNFYVLNSVKQEVKMIYPEEKVFDLSAYLKNSPNSFIKSQNKNNYQKRISSIFSAFASSSFDIPIEVHVDTNSDIFLINNRANNLDDFEGGLVHCAHKTGEAKKFILNNRLKGKFFVHNGELKKVIYSQGAFQILSIEEDLAPYFE